MNEHQPSPDWVEQALRAYKVGKAHGAAVEAPSPELRWKCRIAALGALDVLKMQRYRPQVAAVLGPLPEHFEALARLANIKLDAVFQTLGITRTNMPNAASALAMGRLARHLGMDRTEGLLRLHLGFALATPTGSRDGLMSVLQPVRGRNGERTQDTALKSALKQCEDEYSKSRRAKVQAAAAAFAEAFA